MFEEVIPEFAETGSKLCGMSRILGRFYFLLTFLYILCGLYIITYAFYTRYKPHGTCCHRHSGRKLNQMLSRFQVQFGRFYN